MMMRRFVGIAPGRGAGKSPGQRKAAFLTTNGASYQGARKRKISPTVTRIRLSLAGRRGRAWAPGARRTREVLEQMPGKEFPVVVLVPLKTAAARAGCD